MSDIQQHSLFSPFWHSQVACWAPLIWRGIIYQGNCTFTRRPLKKKKNLVFYYYHCIIVGFSYLFFKSQSLFFSKLFQIKSLHEPKEDMLTTAHQRVMEVACSVASCIGLLAAVNSIIRGPRYMSYIMFLSHCQINFQTMDKMMCYNDAYASTYLVKRDWNNGMNTFWMWSKLTDYFRTCCFNALENI